MSLYDLFACRRQFNLFKLIQTLSQSLLSVIVFLALTACAKQSPDTPQIRLVKSVIATNASDASAYQYTGEVVAHTQTLMGFQVSGRVLKVNVDVGDTVQSGQVLASLDSQDSQNQLESMQANLEDAKTATTLAQANLKRMQLLGNTGAISSLELDQAKANERSAYAKQQSILANMQSAKNTLHYNQLITPATGVVLSRSVNVGQTVQAGQQVFEIASGNTRDAVLQVTEKQRLNLQNFQRLNVQLLANPAIHAFAKIRDVSPQADPDTRTWRVRLSLIDAPPEMALGSAVLVTAEDNFANPTIKIPASALTYNGTQPAVFIINTHHALTQRLIKIDHYTADSIYVREGIKQGERVVTAGVNKLMAGEKVSLMETDQ